MGAGAEVARRGTAGRLALGSHADYLRRSQRGIEQVGCVVGPQHCSTAQVGVRMMAPELAGVSEVTDEDNEGRVRPGPSNGTLARSGCIGPRVVPC